MSSDDVCLLETVREYFRAIESGPQGGDIGRFYTDDAVQVELPNRLNPRGGRSDVATLRQRSAAAHALLGEQHFDLHSETVQGARVAVELVWTATLAVPFGELAAGSVMTAHFAVFFDFRDGRIAHQRNYDCFEPR